MKTIFRMVPLLVASAICALPGMAETEDRVSKQKDADLLAAVRQGSLAGVKAAIENGASPNAADADNTPALLRAVVYCDEKVVRFLLDRGANPNARGADGSVALVLAAGDFGKVSALVAKGADVNLKTGMGRTALLAAAAQRDSYRIVKFLLDKGADPNVRDQAPEFLSMGTGASSLALAVHAQDIRTMQLLLDKAVDVNLANTAGATALIEAISARNVDAVRLLMKSGSKLDTLFGRAQQTPLIWAAFQECPDIVETLIEAGANVNAKDALDSTALVWAAMSERDDTRTVTALLRAGAVVDVKTKMGETPLSWAKRRGNTEIVRLLQKEMTEQKLSEVTKNAAQ